MTTQQSDDVLMLLKILCDEDRLKIVGLLALGPRTVDQLADALHLSATAILQHIALLVRAGVASVADGSPQSYCLQSKTLVDMARRALAETRQVTHIKSEDLDIFDRKVLTDFMTPDGRLKQIPVQAKKFLAVLRYCQTMFEPGIRYSEKEVNQTLFRLHEDTAALRRGLVDHRLMARQSGVYWRTDPNRRDSDTEEHSGG